QNDVLHGRCRKWTPEGILIEDFSFLNGMKNGLYLTYNTDGSRLFEGNYKDNNPLGRQIHYYPGDNKISQYYHYERFDFCDSIIRYYDNGRVDSWFVLDTKKTAETGKTVMQNAAWTASGTLITMGYAYNGNKEGVWQEWYLDGKKKDSINWENDIVQGTCKLWYPNGKPLMVITCKNGEICKEPVCWNQKGQLLKKGSTEADSLVRVYTPSGVYNNTELYRPQTKMVVFAPPVEDQVTEMEVNEEVMMADTQPDILYNSDSRYSQEPVADSTQIYSYVDVQAVFPGGAEVLERYIEKNLKYPPADKKNKKGGVVYVQFVVKKNGEVADAVILKAIGTSAEMEAEALRLIMDLPDWIPATIGGWPVNSQITMPVKFSISL
ncbi:MAG: TonB family protein, partial [Bacteroidia bacterium]